MGQMPKKLIELHGNGTCFSLFLSTHCGRTENIPSPEERRTDIFHQTFLLLNSFDTYPAGLPNLLLQDGRNLGPN